MNDYEAKKQARIDRYKERAKKAENQASQSSKRATDMLDVIPLGQPILVGHHSEKKHRALLKRSDNAMRKASREYDKAKYYREKAAAAENNNAIFSDNPDAINLLSAKIEKAKAYQKLMKSVNKIIRSSPRNKKGGEKTIKLLKLGLSESVIDKLFEPDFAERIGFPSYELTNNNANIKRMESRLIGLQRKKETPPSTTEHDGFTVEECPDDDRIRIIFPDKPPKETCLMLKANGFRFSRQHIAWQRHLNDSGRWAVERVAKALTPKVEVSQ